MGFQQDAFLLKRDRILCLGARRELVVLQQGDHCQLDRKHRKTQPNTIPGAGTKRQIQMRRSVILLVAKEPLRADLGGFRVDVGVHVDAVHRDGHHRARVQVDGRARDGVGLGHHAVYA